MASALSKDCHQGDLGPLRCVSHHRPERAPWGTRNTDITRTVRVVQRPGPVLFVGRPWTPKGADHEAIVACGQHHHPGAVS